MAEVKLPKEVKTLKDFLNHYPQSEPSKIWRNGYVTEVSYNAANNASADRFKGEAWLSGLAEALNKCGITCEDTKAYDLNMSKAVEEFQRKFMQDQVKFGLCNYGVLNDLTISHIVSYAQEKCPDYIDPETGEYIGRSPDETLAESNPHYGQFFNEKNSKQFRQNHKNIRIVFGNSGITKEIHDVVMRSVGVEVDTSGNPISETYEFIARDVTETDEAKDNNNYVSENGVAPSDIQYKFNFKK